MKGEHEYINRLMEQIAVEEGKMELAMFYQKVRHICNGVINPEWSN